METRERSAENAARLVIGPIFALICMVDVDYDALWRVSLNEVRQRREHASSCLVIECNGYSERMPLSTGSTQHVYVRDEWVIVYREVVDGGGPN